MSDRARSTFLAAAALARNGDAVRARERCAAAVFESQAVLAVDPELLSVALYALLVARGFKLLSRLLLAIDGRPLRIEVVPDASNAAEPMRCNAPGGVICRVHPAWLAKLSPSERFLRDWALALVQGEPAPDAMAGSGAQPERSLQRLKARLHA